VLLEATAINGDQQVLHESFPGENESQSSTCFAGGNPRGQFRNQPPRVVVGLDFLVKLLTGVQHGAVVAVAEVAADLGIAGLRQAADDEHGQAAGIGNRLLTGFAL
jgi:hypothetical protein